ncbi:Peroxisomal targeting signal 2 receptor, putative [Perkinsus marinus ATCC 50983]|uniref:Peroxin-7 n=1 Tax=Perkinsus marinus (strain ATCC 50983 / TXsc) TaxID=423536 RepID=C5LBM4_PERM5|nr:Peroxisomal targeting signal 2 receptor, putative [Perkinsus marinus ATCC 50983]EER05845.1 Peroxisomal targeting signal 2 receptor, putative [Perkinsus marinus ATCC 50983]|eukprot:XP_002774029.1 Peroxisomal targeting signal 2 receptor, putative [Perkinsus marinus ATCC 50983]
MSTFQTTTHFAGYSCQFSPFNSHILGVATAQYYGIVGNGKLVVLDLSRSSETKEYITKDGCFDLAWAEDNDKIVFAATGDGSIKVFDITSPTGNLPIANLVGHTAEIGWIECNAMLPTLLASVGWDRVINVWDLPKGAVGLRLEGRHTGVIYACSWSPRNASWLATVGGDAKVCLHDVKAGNQTAPSIVIPHAHDGEILSCDWNKYADSVIVTAGVDRVVRSWDLRNPSAPLVTMAGHELAVRRVKCHPHNSRTVISGGYDMAVFVWDLEANSAQGHLVDRFDHHSEFVYGVDLSLFTSKCEYSMNDQLLAAIGLAARQVHTDFLGWAVPVKSAGCCGFASTANDYSHDEFVQAATHMSKAAGLISHPRVAKIMAEAGAQAGVQGASAAKSAMHALKEAKDGNML